LLPQNRRSGECFFLFLFGVDDTGIKGGEANNQGEQKQRPQLFCVDHCFLRDYEVKTLRG
jgi:hypothetical protein